MIARLWLAALLTVGMTGHANAQSSDPLTLGIVIDVSGIRDIKDSGDDGARLKEQLVATLRQWTQGRLNRYWTVVNTDAEREMQLTVKTDSPKNPPLLYLNLSDNHIDGVARSPLQNRPQMDGFVAELNTVLERFLVDHGAELQQRSASIQAEAAAARGITTDVILKRAQLDPKNAVAYIPQSILVRWAHRGYDEIIKLDGSTAFKLPVYLPPESTRTAEVWPLSYAGHRALPPVVARLCMSRPAIPDVSVAMITYDCPLSGKCTLQQATPTGWADDSCAKQEQGSLWQFFVGTAHAATADAIEWHVPSLQILYERLGHPDTKFIGFTEFEVSAPRVTGLDADAYSVDLRANDMAVRINGLPPEKDIRAFDQRDGVHLRFGLENLQFSGRDSGCEELSVKIQFLKKGQPVGQPVVLDRSYVALRDAVPESYETAYGPFEWTGSYQTPPGHKEYSLFLKSFLFKASDEETKMRGLKDFNRDRTILDGFGWTIAAGDLGLGLGLESVVSKEQQLRIVGKIRPPLTEFDKSGKRTKNGTVPEDEIRLAYGLLVGIEEPNGQMQFTFSRDQSKVMKRHLLTLQEKTPAARRIVPATESGFSEYTNTNDDRVPARNWACPAN